MKRLIANLDCVVVQGLKPGDLDDYKYTWVLIPVSIEAQ